MQTNNSPLVEISRDFDVPPQKLYEAWTEPEQLKQWWKPINNVLSDVTNDLKEGGSVKYFFADNALIISGKYTEVKVNERLVYTWNWEFPEEAARNGSYKLTVEFSAKENGSTLKITQENAKDDEGTYPHQDGWNKGLDELEAYLSGSANNNAGDAASQKTGEAAGYNEDPEQVKVGGG